MKCAFPEDLALSIAAAARAQIQELDEATSLDALAAAGFCIDDAPLMFNVRYCIGDILTMMDAASAVAKIDRDNARLSHEPKE